MIGRIGKVCWKFAPPVLVCGLILLIQACSSGGDGNGNPDPPPVPEDRQSEFVSAPMESYAAAATPAPTDSVSGEDAGDNSDDVKREIQEADIIEIDGSWLYILNQYRGLAVCDISSPDNPVISGRAPINGHPIEMYIRDDMAYVIVSNPYEPVYEIMDTTVETATTRSRIEIVDLSSKSNPVSAGSYEVTGTVTDSRIVGDILYVVSSESFYYYYVDDMVGTAEADSGSSGQNTYIASLDVSNPSAIRIADREDFGGSAQYIHVSETAIFISSGEGFWSNGDTTLTYVDISDPAGRIVTRGSTDVRGRVEDEFKLDYADGYLRVCAWEWENGGVSYLYTIDVSDPDIPRRAAKVELARGEQLFATRFDGNRAYMVTFERIDPLWVIDLSDPENPVIQGELEVPGWSTHIEPRGDRLVALGVDNSDGWKVSVSLFDVADPENPGLLDRVSFGNSSGWSSSTAYGDVKSFNVVDDLGLILLPYSTTVDDGTYRTENHLQLIDFDGNGLTPRGSVTQKGSVLRGRSYSNRIFSVSNDELQVIDATDRDNPQVTGSLVLAMNIVDFVPLNNGHGVQVVRAGDAFFLNSVPLSTPESMDTTGEIALEDSNYSGIFANGNLVYVVSNVTMYRDYSYENHSRITVYDFSSPSSPRKRGTADVEGNYYGIMPYPEGAVFCPYYYGGYEIMQVRNDVLVFAVSNHYWRGYGPMEDDVPPPVEASADQEADAKPEIVGENWFSGIRVLDLSSPDNPVLASEYDVEGENISNWLFKNNIVYYSHNETAEDDERGRRQVSYYLGRIDLANPSAPTALDPVNMPGICVGMNASGTYAYTVDNKWETDGSTKSVFNSVRLDNGMAYLYGNIELDEYFQNFVIADGLAYANRGYRYYGNTYAGFVAIDLADPENLVLYENTLSGTYYASILGAKKRKAFFSVSNGVVCYDMTSPGAPVLDEFRSPGYASHITLTDTKAYLSMGYYGLWVKDL